MDKATEGGLSLASALPPGDAAATQLASNTSGAIPPPVAHAEKPPPGPVAGIVPLAWEDFGDDDLEEDQFEEPSEEPIVKADGYVKSNRKSGDGPDEKVEPGSVAGALPPGYSDEEDASGSSDLDDPEAFLDATDRPHGDEMDLHYSFMECEVALRKFFNNDFEGAYALMKPWCKTSLYHSLGAAIFEFIPAILTFDQEQIAKTQKALKKCLTLCNKHRRSVSLLETVGGFLRKTSYHNYTDLEAHAELCYAEALLLQAAMIIMDGEDLSGLIRGTIRVKTCYNSYKECARILEDKSWDNKDSQMHFLSGVRLGIATFKLMISLLPPKIIALLEFVGFTGDKPVGLMELEAGSREPGLRSVLCELTLLAYHTVICQFVGAPGDLELSNELINKELRVYPDGVWFLMFKARLELLKGEFRKSTLTYTRAINSQQTWRNLRHLGYWELLWINAATSEWRAAASCAAKLANESTWSRTVYTYCRAAMLLQLHDPTDGELLLVGRLIRNVSHFKQRIAGKSLPMEKFLIKRCTRYEQLGNRLILPAVELLCLWNLFPLVAKNQTASHEILGLIQVTRENAEISKEWSGKFAGDNLALCRYLHGAMLSALNLPQMALMVLDSVIELKASIKEDTFLIPYTIVEMALCHYQLGHKERAIEMLGHARRKFSGYSLESRLHFKIHAHLELIKGNT